MKIFYYAYDVLAKRAPDYTFVPGHGDVGKAQDVEAFREYLVALRKLVSDAQAQWKSGDALVEVVTPALEKNTATCSSSKISQRATSCRRRRS